MSKLVPALMGAGAALAVAGQVAAQDVRDDNTGFYGDLGFTYFQTDFPTRVGDEDEITLGALTLRGGYSLLDYVAIEAEAGFGVHDDQASRDVDTSLVEGDPGFDSTQQAQGDIDVSLQVQWLVGLYARLQYPITDWLTVYGRGGGVAFEITEDIDTEFRGSLREEDADGGFAFGGGVQLFPIDRFYFRADYTRYQVNGAESDTYTLSAGNRF